MWTLCPFTLFAFSSFPCTMGMNYKTHLSPRFCWSIPIKCIVFCNAILPLMSWFSFNCRTILNEVLNEAKIQSFLKQCEASSTWHNRLGKESQVELSRLGCSLDRPMRAFSWCDWREKTNLEWGWQFFLGEWMEWAGESELSTACPLHSLFLTMDLMWPIGSPDLLFLGLSTCGGLEPGTVRPEKHFLP